MSVLDEFISSCKIYDKWDDFDFEIVNFPYLDGDVPRRASYSVYISQLRDSVRQCLVMLMTSTLEINYLLLNNVKRKVQEVP